MIPKDIALNGSTKEYIALTDEFKELKEKIELAVKNKVIIYKSVLELFEHTDSHFNREFNFEYKKGQWTNALTLAALADKFVSESGAIAEYKNRCDEINEEIKSLKNIKI